MSWATIRTDPPTEKQIRYATDIRNRLRLDTDLSNMDKWQMRNFISEHVGEFKTELRRQRLANRQFIRNISTSRPRRPFYSDSDFGYGGDDSICDCFDFGIFPWGDS